MGSGSEDATAYYVMVKVRLILFSFVSPLTLPPNSALVLPDGRAQTLIIAQVFQN